jgi:rod shape-determining protein MreD
MRRTPSALGLVVLFAVLVGLNFSLRPLLAWRAPVDFLVIGVLLVAVRVRPGMAAIVGLIAGIVADALAPSAFGAAAMAMTLVAFAASWLKTSFFSEHVVLNAVFLFAAKLGFDVAFLLTERRLSGSGLLMQLTVWSPLSAALTALSGLAVIVLFGPLVGMETD